MLTWIGKPLCPPLSLSTGSAYGAWVCMWTARAMRTHAVYLLPSVLDVYAGCVMCDVRDPGAICAKSVVQNGGQRGRGKP